ncbi:hypothetical protein SAMN05216215_105038 [Saccharopolyspora shandongensis]|uniref:V-type ATPase subunit n=1 Tax=Saccharopolyspora shandongensis TaxID=418495 RepID=A0A1H3QXP6_9PSEU|nr:V-type ATPase subunit [Saccharopolyspora shandongensis]SDZ18023.1 hypothetical protein SAMN05216215_105038 [Saccharopolyspora shandongensis]
MSARWSAGCVRARSLLNRRLGIGGAREVAACSSLSEALHVLAAGPYHQEVRPGQLLEDAERAVAATVLWHLRVLAGWQPHEGAELVRTLAGWFEVTNVVEQTRVGEAEALPDPYHLGALAVSWPRLANAETADELRRALAASPWGDPGGSTALSVAVGMQLAWAVRVAVRVPQAQTWAAGGAALLVARERFLGDCPLAEAAARRAAVLLGAAALDAASLSDFRDRLPGEARWSLSGVAEPGGLWRAEAAWWARVDSDARRLVRSSGFGPDPVVGCIALLGVDARRVRIALELAARGGRPLEAFDVVA